MVDAATEVGLADSILLFVVSWIVGAVAIHLGARLVSDRDTEFVNAALTALVGAIVWGIVAFFFGWIPLLGPLLALLAWLAVINWRYPGDWAAAAAIALVAWVIALVIVYALGVLGVITLDVLGIPGV